MTDTQPEILNLARLRTPIGTAILVTDEAGVLRAFNWSDYEDQTMAWLKRRYPEAMVVKGHPLHAMRAAFQAYFEGQADALSGIKWKAAGTPFQQQVWQALCAIPAGQTISYAELARRLGKPTAMRAVGLANGKNPLGVVVPCHRVIGANGALTGYAGGIERKQWLLRHEGATFKAAPVHT